jgi:hypothetical protein
MEGRVRRRTVRRLRRNAMLFAVLGSLLLAIIVAFEMASRNDDAPVLRVPVTD